MSIPIRLYLTPPLQSLNQIREPNQFINPLVRPVPLPIQTTQSSTIYYTSLALFSLAGIGIVGGLLHYMEWINIPAAISLLWGGSMVFVFWFFIMEIEKMMSLAHV